MNNTTTNTNNQVNKPEGARKPVSPNQTIAEQNHNTMVNNNVIDDNQEELDLFDNTTINNNMEDDSMNNNKLNLNDFMSEEEAIVYSHALVANPAIIQVLNNEIFNALFDNNNDIYTVTEDTIYFNPAILDESAKTILTVALVSRQKNPSLYGEITILNNVDGQYLQLVNENNEPVNNLPRVKNSSIFRRHMPQDKLSNFLRQFKEEKCITNENTQLLYYGQDIEVIFFNISSELKVQLDTEFKATMNMKKVAKVVNKVGTTASTVMSSARKELVPELTKSVTNIGLEVGFMALEIGATAVQETKFKLANYYEEKKATIKADPREERFKRQCKGMINDMKTLLNKNKQDDEYYC